MYNYSNTTKITYCLSSYEWLYVDVQRRVELVAATNVYRSRDVKLDGYT